MTLVLIALGVLWTVELAKELLPWPANSWEKLLTALVIGMVLAFVFVGRTRHTLLVALAAGGLSALLHKVHRLLSLLGDRQVAEVYSRTRTSRRYPRV